MNNDIISIISKQDDVLHQLIIEIELLKDTNNNNFTSYDSNSKDSTSSTNYRYNINDMKNQFLRTITTTITNGGNINKVKIDKDVINKNYHHHYHHHHQQQQQPDGYHTCNDNHDSILSNSNINCNCNVQ